MFQRKITDEEFLNSFQAFGFAARPAISYLLSEKLRDDLSIKADDVKAILLQTLENYYFQTEIVLMLIEAFHQKKLNTTKALVAIYHKVFIKEGENGNYSEELLHKIQGWNNQEFIDYIGLKDPVELIKNLPGEKIKELEMTFESVDRAIAQGYNEIYNLKNSLESIVLNRIGMKEGIKIPFFKMLNKLKHGYQVVEDETENVFSILIDLKEFTSKNSTFEVIEIPIKKDIAYFYTDQIKNMAMSTRHLLHFYMLSNNN
ncbi:MAG: hypothetical protein IPJ23_09485 [Ignavibacteriales bacterium]|nr:hypothetical protein [Ignavibacteriales bacterium]